MIMKRTAIFLGLVLFAAACTPEEPKPAPKASDPEKAPVVVSTTPEANAPDAEVVTEIVVTYDRDILLAPNTTISVNGTYCDDEVYVVGKQLFIPYPIRGGGNTYTVKVTSPSVKDAEGNYCADFSFSFTTLVRNNFDAGAFAIAEEPVDPAATSEAKALYAAMKENFGNKSYSAAMAEVDWNYDNAKAIQQMTGKYPAINAFDYIHLPSSGSEWIDYGDITPVQEWSDMGGIVAAGWHWLVPTSNPNSSMAVDIVDFDDTDLGSWSANICLTQDNVDWFSDAVAAAAMAAFSQCIVGSTITIYYTNASGAQLGYRTHNWANLVDETKTYDFFDLADGDGSTVLTLDATSLAEIKANGFIIGGHDCTITYVAIEHPKENESVEVDFDDVDLGSWAATVCLTQDNVDWYTDAVAAAAMAAFKECVVGSTITVFYKNAAGAQLGYRTHSWANLADETTTYDYFDIADGEGSTVLTLDATSLAEIKANGFIIGGHDCTLTKVEIANPAEQAEVIYSFSSGANEFNPVDALGSGNWQNKVLKADLDKMVTNLKLLQDKNIPVLFRPLHEASGKWFWWGSKSGADFVALWQYVYKYITDAGVHNLLWVWTSCLNDADWYPGDAYVDFIAYDWYPQDAALYHTSGKEAWEALLSISNKKMLTLGECGAMPAINECLEDGVMWSWWMPWYGEFMAEPHNDAATFKSWMAASHVITQ